MVNIKIPTFDEWLATMYALLHQFAYWLLATGWGKYVLIGSLVLLMLWAVAVIHGNVKDTDSFNIREDYWS